MNAADVNLLRPVTIRIDETIHIGMKNRARAQRVQVSLLYEQAAEAYLATRNAPKKDEKKANVLSVPRR